MPGYIPLGLTLLILFLGLYPKTAPLSELWITPFLALGGGAYLLGQRQGPLGLGLIFLGLGDLLWSFLDLSRLPPSPLWEMPYHLGYGLLALGLLKLSRAPLAYTWPLLPLGLLALGLAFFPSLGLDRIYALWDGLLLLILLPRLEPLFRENTGYPRVLLGLGVFLFLAGDLAYLYLTLAQGDYPTGHPLHLLWNLGYLYLAGSGCPKFRTGQMVQTWSIAALLGLFLTPFLLAQPPLPTWMGLFGVYLGFWGGMGFLWAERLARNREEAERARWQAYLEGLARLSPRVTQTLSPEAVLIQALDAVQTLLPQAVGLEIPKRQAFIGEKTREALPLPMGDGLGFIYLKAPAPSPPTHLLELLGERLRQVFRQLDWGLQALTDPLTGLLNRRGLEVELPKLLALARRYGFPLSVGMLDLDHFKRVNDTYGHGVGDQVLRLLGRHLKANLRQEDLAVRYGGEEFLLILYGTTLAEAREVVERIRTGFAQLRLDPIPHPLTLSAGLAGGEVPREPEEVEAWILKADYALLRAKEAGRNRVEMHATQEIQP